MGLISHMSPSKEGNFLQLGAEEAFRDFQRGLDMRNKCSPLLRWKGQVVREAETKSSPQLTAGKEMKNCN